MFSLLVTFLVVPRNTICLLCSWDSWESTAACTGDRAINVAVALETVACNRNSGNDGDDGEGAAVIVAAALSHSLLGSMGSLPLNGAVQTRDHWWKRASTRITRRTGIMRRRQTAGASWLIQLAAPARGSITSGDISAITTVLRTLAVDKLTASLPGVIRGPSTLLIARCTVIQNVVAMN